MRERLSNAEGRRLLGLGPTARSRWSRAKPQRVNGIHFGSSVEAEVYTELRLVHGDKLIPHPRFPLLCLGARDGKPLYFTPDFVVWEPTVTVYEVKGRRSRDYELRRRAFEATYGWPVVELEG